MPKLLEHEFLPQIFWKTPMSTRLATSCPILLESLAQWQILNWKICAKQRFRHQTTVRKGWYNGCETRETLANGCIRLAICCKMALQKQRAVLQLNKIEKFAVRKVTHAKNSGKRVQKWLRNVKSNWAMKGIRQLLKTFCAVTSTLSNRRQANKIHRQNLLEFACNQQKKGKRWFAHCVFPVWRLWTRNYFLVLNTKVVVLKNCWPALSTEVG